MTVYRFLADRLARAGLVLTLAGPSLILGGCSGSCKPNYSSVPNVTCSTDIPTPRAPAPTSSVPYPPTCGGYCAHMRDLACPGAAASPAGATCEIRCVAMQASIAPMDLACRSAASSCAAADACESPR